MKISKLKCPCDTCLVQPSCNRNRHDCDMAEEHIDTWQRFRKMFNWLFIALMVFIPLSQLVLKIAHEKGIVSIVISATAPTIATIVFGFILGAGAFYVDWKARNVRGFYRKVSRRPVKPPPPPPPPPRKIY